VRAHAEMSKPGEATRPNFGSYYLAVHVSDEDSQLHQEWAGHPPNPRGPSIWRWLVGIVVILILACGGAYLAVNVWIGHGLDKARENDGQRAGQVPGFAAVLARAGAQHVITR
jgi:hypothetical protein